MANLSVMEATRRYLDLFPALNPNYREESEAEKFSVKKHLFGSCISSNASGQPKSLSLRTRTNLVLHGSFYDLVKEDVFLRYQDQYKVITDRRNRPEKPTDCGEEGMEWSGYNCVADGCGDAMWRTGLTTIALAIEKDYEKVAQLLDAIEEHGWDNKKNEPRRYPVGNASKKGFSRDQFYLVLAACYFSWKFTRNSPSSAARAINEQARGIVKRFLTYLSANLWKLSEHPGGQLLPPALIVVREVVREMGVADFNYSLRNLYANPLELDWLGAKFLRAKEGLKAEVKHQLNEALKRPSVTVLGKTHHLPKDFRDNTTNLVTDSLFAAADVIEWLVGLIGDPPEIIPGVSWALDEIKDVVRRALDELLGNLLDDVLLWFFAIYVGVIAGVVAAGDILDIEVGYDGEIHDAKMPFYGVHNLFWLILLMYETTDATALSRVGLHANTIALHQACRVEGHNMALLYWITNNQRQTKAWLQNWPRDWNKLNYVWQRSREQQNEALHDFEGLESAPRLDYMILKRLTEDIESPIP